MTKTNGNVEAKTVWYSMVFVLQDDKQIDHDPIIVVLWLIICKRHSVEELGDISTSGHKSRA